MKYSFKWKLDYHPGLRTTIAQKQHFFTPKHCFRANFFTIYSFLLWISHIFIHSIIHSIVCWKIFIQRIHSFNKKSKLFIQRIYSFKTIPNYQFKENIHSNEKWIIAQGYFMKEGLFPHYTSFRFIEVQEKDLHVFSAKNIGHCRCCDRWIKVWPDGKL